MNSSSIVDEEVDKIDTSFLCSLVSIGCSTIFRFLILDIKECTCVFLLFLAYQF
jgi:hypothetical protein